MKDIITIAAVNFSAVWGNKQQNLNRIIGYIECAAKRGADIILLPELALTGYDGDEFHCRRDEKMHCVAAETINGEAVTQIAAVTRQKGVYAVFGMPERDAECPDKVYNAAVVTGPDGFIMSYRKRNLPNDETTWACSGKSPVVFDTAWGLIGIGICADVYDFPEFARYARAKGARIFLNPTAMPLRVSASYPRTTVEALAATCSMYVVSADLYGIDRVSEMMGGSSIIGPANQKPACCQGIHYYAGKPFDAPDAAESELVLATVDLSLVSRSYMDRLWSQSAPQWNPEEFISLYKEIQEEQLCARSKNDK